MKQFFVLTAMVISAVGAVSGPSHAASRPKPQAEVLRTDPELIAFTERKPASMTNGAFTPVVVQGGLVGALALVATKAVIEHVSGKNLVEKHQLVDPAQNMSREVAFLLAEQRGAAATEQPISIKGERPKAIAKIADGARYIVDIRTVRWDLAGSSMEAGRQEASYMASLRVIDGLTGVVAVETECRWAAPVIKNPDVSRPTDKGDNLRDHFSTAREACVEQLKMGMRTLYLPATRLAEMSSRRHRDAGVPVRAELSKVEHHALPITPIATTALAPMPTPPPPVPPIMPPPAASLPAPTLYAQPRPLPEPPWIEYRGAPTVVAVAPTRSPIIPSTPPAATQRTLPIAVYAQAAPNWERPRDATQPPYVEYPYARPNEAPPSRRPPPEVRYAGRDANGFLTWPGKRP